MGVELCFHQLLVSWINQGIILEEKRGRKVILIDKFDLLLHHLEQKTVCVLHTVIRLPDKIDDVDDTGRIVDLSVCHAGDETKKQGRYV
ncbi:hypothetical protein [Sphingobacterium alkalisoli]|uniref:hypothetical protein n=1 Tax=Sphingobacterium alkalisoli TaxID=1874115 RepID=UPI001B808556|nr:hypothetical protein [Sphingobacterium alkalisoli]